MEINKTQGVILWWELFKLTVGIKSGAYYIDLFRMKEKGKPVTRPFTQDDRTKPEF